MSTKPLYRVSFSRKQTDGEEGETLGYAREIGAIWPRANGKPGGVLRLDHVPIELTKHEGVIFITPA